MVSECSLNSQRVVARVNVRSCDTVDRRCTTAIREKIA